MDPFEFTVSADAHAALVEILSNLDLAMQALCDTLSQIFDVLGSAAAASLPAVAEIADSDVVFDGPFGD